MKTTIRGLALAGFLLLPAGAKAQVHIDIGIQFPGPPPLVLVSPEVQVVPEIEEEVFYVGGWYWVRWESGWYRSRRCCNAWYPVRPHVVPAAIVRIPPGHYKRYYRDDDGRWRPHHSDDYRAWRARNSWDDRHRWWRKHRHDRHFRGEQRRSWEERRHDEPWHHRRGGRDDHRGGRDDRGGHDRRDNDDHRRDHDGKGRDGHGRDHDGKGRRH